MGVRVIGLDKALRSIEGVEKALRAPQMEPVLLAAAEAIRDEAVANAPQGESGTLKAAIKAEVGKRRNGNASVYAAVDRKVMRMVNGRKFRAGNYAHLVESGAKPHIIKPRAVGFVANRRGSGKLAFNGRVVSQVSHPGVTGTRFFSRAVKTMRGPVRRMLEDGVRRLIDNGAKY